MQLRHVVDLVVVSLMTARLTHAAPQFQSVDSSVTSDGITTQTASVNIPTSTTSSTPTDDDACARLAVLAQESSSPNPIVPAEAAWACLQAIPFDPSTAETWLASLRPYLRWQTTTAYLRDPPDGYQLPAYDLYGTFDQVLSQALDGNHYRSQYDFELDVYSIFQQAHDGHLSYVPNLLRVASFGRPFALVAISSDGTERPQPYVYSDILLSYNDAGFEPSAVSEIDGQEVTNFLERYSLHGAQHDPDALWNNLFFELAQVQLGEMGQGAGLFSGGGRGAYVYPNATTTLTFENGTTREFDNVARLEVPFSYITSAQDVYRNLVDLEVAPEPPLLSSPANLTLGPGYPSPVVRHPYNFVNGYYLSGDGYEDVAVLGLASFEVLADAANLSAAFLDRAKADNKTRLVIDLSANSGGNIVFGFQLFAKLFPNIFPPYLGTRLRATETVDIIGQTMSDWSNGTSDITTLNTNGSTIDITDPEQLFAPFFNGLTPFPYASDTDENYEAFPDWRTKFGPREFYGDNFTSIIRWNLSQPGVRVDLDAIVNASVTSSSSATSPEPQALFDAADIVILTDGYCASTCSNFVEMMTQQAGVRTVTVGGRPNNVTNNTTNDSDSMAPPHNIQVVGGTRGPNTYLWTVILSLAGATYSYIANTPSTSLPFNSTDVLLFSELGEYLGQTGETSYDPLLPFRRGGYANAINVRDAVRENDTETPLQFVYQATDCRIFWTREMTVDVTALWERVVDVTWNSNSAGGGGGCVAGTLGVDDNDNSGLQQRSVKARVPRSSRTLTPDQIQALDDSVHAIWSDRDADLVGIGAFRAGGGAGFVAGG